MSLELSLSEELDTRLKREAERRGESEEQLAIQLLEQHLPTVVTKLNAVELLKSWAVQAETQLESEAQLHEDVLRAIDADRSSNRPLFKELLDGVKE